LMIKAMSKWQGLYLAKPRAGPILVSQEDGRTTAYRDVLPQIPDRSTIAEIGLVQ
jgi:hypothetical protein